MERIKVLLALVSLISSVLSISAALRARHDRIHRALAFGLLAAASVGFCAYLVTFTWNDFRTRIAAREQELRVRAEQGDKTVATLLAENKRKDQRIAHLEAQLGFPRTGGTNGGSLRPGTNLGASSSDGAPTSGTPACPLNDTWECAEELTFGGQDSDEYRASDRERFYYVDLVAARAFTITVDPVPAQGVTVSIHDALRRELNRDLFSRPASLDTRVRETGRYYVKVQLWGRAGDRPSRYTITLSS